MKKILSCLWNSLKRTRWNYIENFPLCPCASPWRRTMLSHHHHQKKMNFISCNLVKVIINFIPCFIAPAADGCDDCWLHDETQFLSFVNWIHVNASHVLRPQQHQKFRARSAPNVSRESRWCFWFMKSQRTAGLLLVSTYNLQLNSFLSD